MNDLFISYAHIDDLPISEDQKGWISEFHRVLQNRLAQLMGEKPKIWRDQKLSGSDIFDNEIVDQFKNTKLMVSVLSPRYIKSEWCNKEIKEFYRNAELSSGVALAGKSRVLKVVKTPYDPQDVHPELKQVFGSVLGFNFYDFDNDSGKVVEYNEAFGKEARQNYFTRIYDLAYEICEILKKSDDKRSGLSETTLPKQGAKTVYLATTTADRNEDRENIARDLRERGHLILPDRQLPFDEETMKGMICQFMERADVAIHLLGSSYGMIPEAGDKSIIESQIQISAQEASNNEMERLIWLPNQLKASEEKQKDFVDRLRVDPATYQRTDFVEGSFETFKGLVIDHFSQEPKDIAGEATMDSNNGLRTVYLMAPPNDEEKIEAIEDYLFDQGLEVVIPVFSGTESDVAEAHMENLRICDSVLIYFGSATRQWVNMKLNNMIKASGQGRKQPIREKAILIAPPESRHKDRFRSHLAELIHIPDADLGPLDEFIKKIKTND
ncbi:toll/interleukin-1 receptor domain-containing protein [Verrucomicrobia bacterium]|nr:toll/interleukin-1 receptor domain-containing protein [Verrucomicrobiota bacterium]